MNRMSQEDEYVKPKYCLSCSAKHSRDLEHHLEDLRTGSSNDTELRAKAQEMIDKARDLRREIDNMRIDERAKEKLQETV